MPFLRRRGGGDMRRNGGGKMFCVVPDDNDGVEVKLAVVAKGPVTERDSGNPPRMLSPIGLNSMENCHRMR